MKLRWWYPLAVLIFLLLIFHVIHASPVDPARYVLVMKLYDRVTGEPVSAPIPVRINGERQVFSTLSDCQKVASSVGPIEAHAGVYVLLDCRPEYRL